MNLKLTTLTHLVIGVSFSVITVDALKCYVCGDEGELPCNDFDLKKDNYAKDCLPPHDQGCEKRTEGNSVIRKCSDRKFSDCKRANAVEYCYCLTDLCNSKSRGVLGPTDDEDLIEGSGVKTLSTGSDKPFVTKGKSGGTKAELYCSMVVMPVVAVFYNK